MSLLHLELSVSSKGDLRSEVCISYIEDITIGGYWKDLVHDFQRVELVRSDMPNSYHDHTTLGSLLVDILGLLVVNPEPSTFLDSPIGGVEHNR